jgi:hypothetical protein
MQNQFVITIDSRVTPDFAINFLRSVNFIKSIKPQKQKGEVKDKVNEVMFMAESSLAKEWLSPEEDEAWKDL